MSSAPNPPVLDIHSRGFLPFTFSLFLPLYSSDLYALLCARAGGTVRHQYTTGIGIGMHVWNHPLYAFVCVPLDTTASSLTFTCTNVPPLLSVPVPITFAFSLMRHTG